jgi:hypothetical protein
MSKQCAIDEHEWVYSDVYDAVVCRVCGTWLHDAGETEAMRQDGEYDDNADTR